MLRSMRELKHLQFSCTPKHNNKTIDGALSNAELDAFAKDTNGDVVSALRIFFLHGPILV